MLLCHSVPKDQTGNADYYSKVKTFSYSKVKTFSLLFLLTNEL